MNMTLQHTNTLNHTILLIIQRLIQTRLAQCQEHIIQFQHDLQQVNNCIQQLQDQRQADIQQT